MLSTTTTMMIIMVKILMKTMTTMRYDSEDHDAGVDYNDEDDVKHYVDAD